MSQWGAQIMARIERARPRVRGSGQVVLALQITRDGGLAGLSVARSSGDAALDNAALSAVQRAGRFPAAPKGLTDASYGFSLPIRFR
jgi:protein TonB